MKYVGEYTKEISFPLGGIGSGSIGLGGDGRLIDWDIFNKPQKGSLNGFTHFAIKAITQNGTIVKILNGDLLKDYTGQFSTNNFGTGPSNRTLAGFPHFRNVEFNGEFPIAKLTFTDDDFPGKVILTAFNPFIPLNEDDSSIPAAFFEIAITNDTGADIEYQVAFTVANPFENGKNEHICSNGRHFLKLSNADNDEKSPEYGDLTISTDSENAKYQTYWYRGRWQDNIVTFWNEFSGVEDIRDRKYEDADKGDHGTLYAKLYTASNTTEKVRFVLSWNIPNMYCYWIHHGEKNGDGKTKFETWKNYYAILFENSVASADYSLKNWNRLYNETILFKETLHSSTLDPVVVDAVSSNISVLKSPTVFRLEDGTFYGWEGVFQDHGSCEGTCEHVWNYAYALCFLFPNLERSIRDAEFKYATDEQGLMSFRMALPVGAPCYEKRPCVDGQMGSIIKTYREWKISGDNDWLTETWPTVKKVLEYAWSEENPFKWDIDKDGILEGRQHHTLDMELFGPSSWLEGMYLLALKLAAEMAEFVGDAQSAKEYISLYENGRKFMKDELFNGEYFIHKIDINDKSVTDRFNASDIYWNDEKKQIKYQVAGGSIIDQMLGQWHSYILGGGDIFDKAQTDIALDSMMKYNFIPSMRNFANPWRIFCLNDEGGAVMCAYPDHVEKPAIPVPYCEENMTGFEYSFAGMLIAAGKIEDGIKVIKAIRDRYDGKKRNPWNEIECGSNYARTMASFAFLPIFSGFEFDLTKGHIGFAPKIRKDDFKCIFSLGTGWGYFEQKYNTATIKLNGGKLSLSSIALKNATCISKVIIDGKDVSFRFDGNTITFEKSEVTDKVEIIL
ncbi:MAG: GH116 family glycosyl-hydrolase [Acutalibacteraceae bacterium]|nr:GH116 family glycosyl-hydrolase [Acutalibacteraceae bacterium]